MIKVMLLSKRVSKNSNLHTFLVAPEAKKSDFSCHAKMTRKRTRSVDKNEYAFVSHEYQSPTSARKFGLNAFLSGNMKPAFLPIMILIEIKDSEYTKISLKSGRIEFM